jgi:hypothetical protein
MYENESHFDPFWSSSHWAPNDFLGVREDPHICCLYGPLHSDDAWRRVPVTRQAQARTEERSGVARRVWTSEGMVQSGT